MAPRTISFSGRRWLVKRHDEPHGPGPNLWSDGPEHVHVDAEGRLHLRAARLGGRWWCAEVVATEPCGHGLTRWVVDTPSSALRDTGVLGLFTWDDAPPWANRELDVETSRWGGTGSPRLTWSVQATGDQCRIQLAGDEAPLAHTLDWQPTAVTFGVEGRTVSSWRVQRRIDAGEAGVRMNCWLAGGRPPATNEPIEVVISSVELPPLERA